MKTSKHSQSRHAVVPRCVPQGLETLEPWFLLSAQAGADTLGPDAPVQAAMLLGVEPQASVSLTSSDASEAALTPGAGNWSLKDWQYRKRITIDPTKVAGALTNFPVLVSLTDASLASRARTDAADIVFTAEDGTLLPHEIEGYDPLTGKLTAWVRLPQVTTTQATVFYMYFANPTATPSQNPGGVWDSSYLGVHHLEELSGTVTDSTTLANNGTALNGVARNVTTQIAKGYRFDGVNDRITMPQLYSGSRSFTIEGWVYPNAKQGYIFCQYAGTSGVFLQYYPSSSEFQLYINGTKLVAKAAANAWHHVAATFDGTTARLYCDKVLMASAPASVTWPPQQSMIGDRPALNRAFKGSLDELRFSSIARSAAYLQTSYNNTKSPSTFMTFQEEQGNLVPEVTLVSPQDNQTLPEAPPELLIDILDPRGDLLDYTITTSPDIGSVSATGVAGGRIAVPLAGVQPNITYTVLVQADDGTNHVTKTYSFTVGTKWGYASCLYRQAITIDHTRVPSDATNFPVCIDVVDPGLIDKIQENGADIIFTGADAVTPLKHEIELFDATTGHLVAWVSVPQLSSQQDTSLFMYYGDSDPEVQGRSNPPAVWTGDYLAVHHMANPEGKLQDSTSHGLDGEPRNGVLQGVAGRIGNSIQEDGLDDGIELTQLYSGSTPFSVEGWVNSGNLSGYIFCQRNTLNEGAVLQYHAPSRSVEFFVNNVKMVAPAPMGQWFHVVGSFDGTTAKLYINGVLMAEQAATITWPNINTWLGDHNRFDRTLLGQLDEVRLFDRAVDATYVSLSYAAQNGAGAMATFGARQRSSNSLAFTNVYPATHDTDIEFNPTLRATITDLEGRPFNYHVDVLTASGWVTLASGTGVSGPYNLSVPTTGIDSYGKVYVWRVVADAAGDSKEQIFDFTTRLAGNYSPMILNASPENGASAIGLGPTLQAMLKDVDYNLMNVTFSILDPVTSKWVVLKTYTGAGNGVLAADATAYVNRPYYDYTWKITAVDPSGSNQVREQVFTFRTGGALGMKWSAKLDLENTVESQLMPVIGDIDNDGEQEIVLTSGDSCYSLNGKTGQIEWQIKGEGRETAPELVDLDDDGVPEVIYGLSNARVRAVRGDGTIMWTSKHLVGNDQSMFPLLTCDIDGDGYPEIYFCTEDTNPVTYSGEITDYTGALCMLDHNGNLLRSTWLFHPCWGGASLADANGDGKVEIFVSDRRYGYNDVPSHGLAAYDAATLEMLWSRPDIHHSSPIPIIADVNKDGKLEVVAERIVGMGPMILDAMTGATIKDYSNRGLPTHGTGTLADLDNDGNLELIMASSYPMTTACDFVVFDLVTGRVEFRPTFEYHASWPPRIGDVTGDGVPEILAAMGDQGSTSNFPLLVYDNKYNLIDRVDVGAGQLGIAKIFDCDNDGLNEIIVAGAAGKLAVIDTPAPAPAIAPRAGVQMYGEARNSNPVYQPAPGPQAPILSNFAPGTGALEVEQPIALSAKVFDWQGEKLTVTFELAEFDGVNWVWKTVKTYANMHRGVFTAPLGDMGLKPGTTYRWRVSAKDIVNNTTASSEMEFTTASATAWQLAQFEYRHRLVVNGAKIGGNLEALPVLVDVTLPDLAANAQSDGDDLRFVDLNGQLLPYEIESYDAASGRLRAFVRLGAVSAQQNAVFYLYYGNSQASDGQDPAATWAGYTAVHHLEEVDGLITDSTTNHFDGTPLNGVLQGQTGTVGNGVAFDGVDDRLQFGQIFTTQTAFTIEGWVNPASQQGHIFNQRDSMRRGVLLQYYAGMSQFELLLDGAKLTAKASPDAWHYVCATFDGTTATLSVDGQPAVSAPATATWPAIAAIVGDQAAGGRPFRGLLDELRISDQARTDAYCQIVWNNLSDPQGFLAVKALERQGTPQIEVQAPPDAATGVSLSTTSMTFRVTDFNNDLMNIALVIGPGDVGGIILTQVPGGEFVAPLANLQPETTYVWLITASDGSHTALWAGSFTTEALPTPPDPEPEPEPVDPPQLMAMLQSPSGGGGAESILDDLQVPMQLSGLSLTI